jgi:hypothetical protein
MVVEMTFRVLKGWWKDWICHYEIYWMWLQLAFFFIMHFFALSMEITLTWNGFKKLNKQCKWKPTISLNTLIEISQNVTTPFVTTCDL